VSNSISSPVFVRRKNFIRSKAVPGGTRRYARRLPERRGADFLPLTHLRKAIEVKFDRWLAEAKGVIAPIPYDKIDWSRVVNDAIWRIPPFVEASEEKDAEKGFRDCLVLETLESVVKAAEGRQVVFVSGDNLLREAAIQRFGSKLLAAYESITGFASFLELTHKQNNQEYIQLILEKAPKVFFTENDPECAYIKFNVANRIMELYSFLLDTFSDIPTPTPSLALVGAGIKVGIYAPASQEKMFIDSTEYDDVIADETWKWKTQVRSVRLFKETTLAKIPSDELGWLYEVIRIQQFDVFWTATIDEEGNFSNVAIAAIMAGKQTSEQGFGKSQYGL
jgi:PIN domain